MTEQQLKDLLADMSLEEKIGQMVQLTANFYGTDMLITGPMGSAKIEPEDMKLCGTILGTSGAAKLKEIQDNAMVTQPHHIPILFMLDVSMDSRRFSQFHWLKAAALNQRLLERARR